MWVNIEKLLNLLGLVVAAVLCPATVVEADIFKSDFFESRVGNAGSYSSVAVGDGFLSGV